LLQIGGLPAFFQAPTWWGLEFFSWSFYWINFAEIIIGFLLMRRFITKLAA
jgi:hypothetical protein